MSGYIIFVPLYFIILCRYNQGNWGSSSSSAAGANTLSQSNPSGNRKCGAQSGCGAGCGGCCGAGAGVCLAEKGSRV